MVAVALSSFSASRGAADEIKLLRRRRPAKRQHRGLSGPKKRIKKDGGTERQANTPRPFLSYGFITVVYFTSEEYRARPRSGY